MRHSLRSWPKQVKIRRRIARTFGLAVLISAFAGTNTVAQVDFEQYKIKTGFAERQTVLVGFLLKNAIADLAVVDIDANRDRRLRIYAFADSTWVVKHDARLGPEVLFVDVATIGGQDLLITYDNGRHPSGAARGRLNWFDPESLTERPLVAVTSNFDPPRRNEIPHVDVTRDVNSDGRDDLVVPDADGFWIFIQTSGGAFADPVKLGPATATAMIAGPDEGYRYTPWDHSRIHEMDYNRDGLSDLVFWNEDHFEVHLQDQRGLFDTAGETFATHVPFDTDDLTSLAAPYRYRRPSTNLSSSAYIDRTFRAETGSALHQLSDLNGDGIADLGIFSLEGGSPWKMHSSYEVHIGTLTADGGTRFAPEASTVAPADGVPVRIQQHDTGKGGQGVVMFTTINMRGLRVISKVVGALLTRSMTLDLEFYRMEGGLYPDESSASRKTPIYALGKDEKASVLPAVLIGDVNGDSYSDLLVGKGHNELRVYLGVSGPELFDRRYLIVPVAMASEEYTWLVDVNKDAKQDVFMHHSSTTEPYQVTILVAR